MRYRLLYILLALLALTSCTTDTICRQDMGVWLGVGLQADSLKQVADSLPPDTVAVTSLKGLQITGVGRDSLLLDESQTFSTLYLPLRKDTGLCAYRIAYRGLTDTLTLHYDRQFTYVSLACGCAVMATLDEATVTGSLLDSAVLINQAVTTKKEKHLVLYMHVPQ